LSPFCWSVRIYWEDTDAGGVVYYGNYLKYLERARTEWLRSLGFSQHALAQDPGIVFPVTDVKIQYQRPARLDDELVISCDAQIDGAASISFVQRISRHAGAAAIAAETLAEAQVRIACVDASTFRPKRLPDFIKSALVAPEPN